MSLKRSLTFTLLSLLSLQAGASADNVHEFQSKILYKRAREVLHYRMEELKHCRNLSRAGFLLRNYRRYNSHKFRTQNERLLQTLELLSRTNSLKECSKETAKADERLKKLQRRKLHIPLKASKTACLTLPQRERSSCLSIIEELDPFCATQNSPDIFGVKDPNPCMAGDRLLGKVLRKKNDPNQENINYFLSALEEKINSSSPGDKIDLWNVFLELEHDTPENRKNFVAIVTFFYYALGTAGGYVDGIADYYWMSSLNENPAFKVFPEYFSLRQNADWYRNLIRGEGAKGRTFVITGIDIKQMNRHDFMSMFLSCHFKKYGGVVSKLLPNLLGIGYESLDFVSHIKEKVTVKRSIENFSTDTNRYRRGTAWANSFCSN